MSKSDITAAEIGRKGGGVISELKAAAAIANGKKGGRPRQKPVVSRLSVEDHKKLKDLAVSLVVEAKEHAATEYENGSAYDRAHDEFFQFLNSLKR